MACSTFHPNCPGGGGDCRHGPCNVGGGGFVSGRRLQFDLDCLFYIVRGPWRRLRNPVQRALSRRAPRHHDLGAALQSAATKAGIPLALATVAITVGFISFMPTDYLGLSELGEIAGIGMVVAFFASITLLPALLTVLNPGGEPNPLGLVVLAPVDRFMARHRVPIVAITILAVTLASPLLLYLPFDFNPLHLQNPKVEIGGNLSGVEKRSTDGRKRHRDRSGRPRRRRRHGASNRGIAPGFSDHDAQRLVPQDQDEKIKLIHAAAAKIDASLNPEKVEEPPTDQDNISDLSGTSESLLKSAASGDTAGADAARRLAGLLSKLAAAEPSARARAQSAIAEPLKQSLNQLRQELQPQRVSIGTLPSEIAREWVAPDGRYRIEVLPKGDPENTDTLRSFVTAVLGIAPQATGPAVLLFEFRENRDRAFIISGAFALSAITVILFVALRRVGDVLADADPVADRRNGYFGTLRGFPSSIELRQYYCLAVAAGRRCCFQDLLYYGVEGRENRPAAIQPDPRRAV